MTDNQKKRIQHLASYVRNARSVGKPVSKFDIPEEKLFHEFCTNILASIILIEEDE